MQLGFFVQNIVQSQSIPRNFPCPYDPHFLAANEADALFRMVSSLPHFQAANVRAGKIQGYIKRLTMPSWSASATFRGVEEKAKLQGSYKPNYAEAKNFLIERMDTAPKEVRSLAIKLSRIAGKPVNYFALVGYANKTHYIDWHQHHEDRARDARVFIISLGAARQFGLREICPDCRVCDACNEAACDGHNRKCAECKSAKKHRETCPTRLDKKKWHLLYPTHGSLITLPSEYNWTHEHAVQPDKNMKGLRVSINTKCIPTDETLSHFIERMEGEPSPLSPDTPEVQQQKRKEMARNLHKKLVLARNPLAKKIADELLLEFPAAVFLAEENPVPRVYDCHAGQSYPPDAVYVGREVRDRRTGNVTWPATPFGNYKKLTGDAFRAYAADKMKDAAFRAQLESLRGKNLLCWCRPHERDRCHAQIWLELANALASKGHEQEKA